MSTTAPEFSLRATGRVRRRQLVNRASLLAASLAALVAVAVLGLLIGSVIAKAASAINLDFITKDPATFGMTGGGIANALVGTGILILIAMVIAVPIGVFAGIYTSEFAKPAVSSTVRLVLDVLNGVPSIIIGIFIFGLLVVGHKQSGWSGGIALAIIMLPIIARSTQEVLALVPGTVKEAGLALGISRWRTFLAVVLPAAFGGIITATLLGVARVAGETAPLLFTSSIAANTVTTDPSQALPSIPVTIFTYSESPSPDQHAQAWAAALVLIVFVLLISIVARVFAARARRRATGR